MGVSIAVRLFRRGPRPAAWCGLALGAVLGLMALAPARAQSPAWPAHPVRFIVPLTAGGSNDFVARVIAERLQPALGQPVVVENRPGAGGNVGTEYTAHQPPDGYTILLSSNTHVMNVSFYRHLPYDPLRDFEPISLAATVPFVMTVNSSLPVHNLAEFLAYARAHPGQVTYGSAGVGTPHQLSAELLRTMTAIEMTHVPYKGAAGIVPALLGGEITMTIGAINSLLPHIRQGKLRAIAVAADHRTAILPDVPTIAESGLPGFNIEIWLGVLAPAGTPRPIIDRLNAEINKIVRDPEVIRDKLNPNGLEGVGSTPEQYREVMRKDLVRYAKIAKDAHIEPE
jgi:tripartite-type tricarboxylate transporter receptor subunit TctC